MIICKQNFMSQHFNCGRGNRIKVVKKQTNKQKQPDYRMGQPILKSLNSVGYTVILRRRRLSPICHICEGSKDRLRDKKKKKKLIGLPELQRGNSLNSADISAINILQALLQLAYMRIRQNALYSGSRIPKCWVNVNECCVYRQNVNFNVIQI